jgi:hypothetical protein
VTPEQAIADRKALVVEQGYLFNREERAMHLSGLGRHVSSVGAAFVLPVDLDGTPRPERDVNSLYLRTVRCHLRDVADEERIRAAQIAAGFGASAECVEAILGSSSCPGSEKAA